MGGGADGAPVVGGADDEVPPLGEAPRGRARHARGAPLQKGPRGGNAAAKDWPRGGQEHLRAGKIGRRACPGGSRGLAATEISWILLHCLETLTCPVRIRMMTSVVRGIEYGVFYLGKVKCNVLGTVFCCFFVGKALSWPTYNRCSLIFLGYQRQER